VTWVYLGLDYGWIMMWFWMYGELLNSMKIVKSHFLLTVWMALKIENEMNHECEWNHGLGMQ
jgi:hypothetical protein